MVIATPLVFTYGSHLSRVSAGVFPPNVFLGLALRAAATGASGVKSAEVLLLPEPYVQ